jgi:SPP1 gp7 family putative phage head morphogenesis protein
VKELPPIRESGEDFDAIKAAIAELFKKEIYLPLIKELGLKSNVLKNSLDDLIQAVQTGRISFYRGKFSGRFNSKISRELKALGATWNKRENFFEISMSELPIDLANAIRASEDAFLRTAAKIDKRLSDMVPEEIAQKLKIENLYDHTIYKMDKRFEQTVKGLVVAPKFTPEQRARIAKDYSNNMKLYIKDWAESAIKELRQKLQKSTFEGARYETMQKHIQRSYGVSQNKAKFLARQETGLLIAKFREVRYADIGIDEYKWTTVKGTAAHPVRPMHKRLDGKVFSFKNPPVVDNKGSRKNPGEDFGCRCTAIPIVKF